MSADATDFSLPNVGPGPDPVSLSALVADPDTEAGDACDQPVRFGFLGHWSDFLGRQPEAVLVDLRDAPEIVWQYHSKTTFDRPSIDDLLAAVDEAR